MTIDWTRKHALPRIAVFALRALGILAIAAALAGDVYYLHCNWHHFVVVERAGWLADYARLKTLIETQYPSLDWVVTRGGLDLNRLDARTAALLESAESAGEAERALRDFVRAFHDGHMAIRRSEAPLGRARKDLTLSASTSGATACDALGYEEDDGRELELEFPGSARFRSLPGDGPFAAGLIEIEGRKAGIVRIRSFDPGDYARTCASEWDRFRSGLATTCEAECADVFEDAVISRLLDELASRIRQVTDAGATTLAVDVRGNGGGYGAFEHRAAELLAGRPVPKPARELIGGEDTASSLGYERRWLERALDHCPGQSRARQSLEAAFWRVERAAAGASVPCDRSAVWSAWGARPRCDGLIPFEGLDDVALAEVTQATLPRSAPRVSPLDSIPRRARWQGPLVVLTNRYTGSAAEVLAGSLQDHAGASVIGQRSHGSGGGWILGRRYWFLENSGLTLVLPDHVAYRKDGTSYQAGVTPDIAAAFDPREDDAAKARELVRGLRELWSRAGGGTPSGGRRSSLEIEGSGRVVRSLEAAPLKVPADLASITRAAGGLQ